MAKPKACGAELPHPLAFVNFPPRINTRRFNEWMGDMAGDLYLPYIVGTWQDKRGIFVHKRDVAAAKREMATMLSTDD